METNRRKNTRYYLEWPVSIVTSQGTIVGETRNLSGDGAFISCRHPLSPEEMIALSIRCPDGCFAKVSSQVVWSCMAGSDDEKGLCGMGVRFLW
jgi:hypothetical protein